MILYSASGRCFRETVSQALGHYIGQHQRYGHKWIYCQIRDYITVLNPLSESHTRQFETLPFPKRLKCDSDQQSIEKTPPQPPVKTKSPIQTSDPVCWLICTLKSSPALTPLPSLIGSLLPRYSTHCRAGGP